MQAKVEAALERVRPYLQADGGDLRLIEVTPDGVVRLELTGVCGHCQMSDITLTYGVERLVRLLVPEVQRVEQVKSETLAR